MLRSRLRDAVFPRAKPGQSLHLPGLHHAGGKAPGKGQGPPLGQQSLQHRGDIRLPRGGEEAKDRRGRQKLRQGQEPFADGRRGPLVVVWGQERGPPAHRLAQGRLFAGNVHSIPSLPNKSIIRQPGVFYKSGRGASKIWEERMYCQWRRGVVQ